MHRASHRESINVKIHIKSIPESHAKSGLTTENILKRLQVATVDAREAELWQAYTGLFAQSKLSRPTDDPVIRRAHEIWAAHYNATDNSVTACNVIAFRKPGVRA